MIGNILLIIWGVGFPIMCVLGWRFIYDGPEHPKPGEIPGGNKRWATVIAPVFGFCWPLLIAFMLLHLFVDWLNEG